MLKIGVTGGIGSGKSEVSKRLASLGAFVFDADEEAKNIINTNKIVKEQLTEEFGADLLNSDQSINTKRLAEYGLANEDSQAILNSIVHPFVFNEVDARFVKIEKKKKYSMFVVDAALIFESGLDQHLDYVIHVTAALGTRMKRALARGTLNRKEIQKRINLQLPEESKKEMAHFVIDNNGTSEDLVKQVDKIYKELV